MVALNDRNSFSHSSEGQKSTVSFTELKSRCQQGCAPFTDSGEKFLPWLVKLLISAGIPLLWTHQPTSTCLHITFTSSVCQIFPALLEGYLWWHLGPMGIIQDYPYLISSHLMILNLITSTKSLFPYKIIFKGFRDWDRVSLGAII